MNSKSQIFSLDTMFSLAIFMAVIAASFWAWDMADQKIAYSRHMGKMEAAAKNSMNTLVTTAGDPAAWHLIGDEDLDSIHAIGIVKDRYGVASQQKINRLLYLGNSRYNDTKDLFGISSTYEFYLEIGGNTSGIMYGPLSENVLGVDRMMMLGNGSIVEIKLRVWK